MRRRRVGGGKESDMNSAELKQYLLRVEKRTQAEAKTEQLRIELDRLRSENAALKAEVARLREELIHALAKIVELTDESDDPEKEPT